MRAPTAGPALKILIQQHRPCLLAPCWSQLHCAPSAFPCVLPCPNERKTNSQNVYGRKYLAFAVPPKREDQEHLYIGHDVKLLRIGVSARQHGVLEELTVSAEVLPMIMNCDKLMKLATTAPPQK